MCGRFSLGVDTQVIAERFEVAPGTFDWGPRYNIAPTQLCSTIIVSDNKRIWSQMRWGLIPHWSKEQKTAFQMINARADSVTSKPIYREIFKKRRCLVPADGFYEWKKTSRGKVPFRVTLNDEKPFAFAGLWDSWQDEKGVQLLSFTIVTTEANSLVAPLHDRMPLILKREDEAKWLDPSLQDTDKLEPLLKPYPAEDMKLYEVLPIVNSWKEDNPECIQKNDQSNETPKSRNEM